MKEADSSKNQVSLHLAVDLLMGVRFWACIDSHHDFVEADRDRFSPFLSLHSVASSPPSPLIICYDRHKVGQQPLANVEVVKGIFGHWFEHPHRFTNVEITGWFIYYVYILSSIASLALIVSPVWFFFSPFFNQFIYSSLVSLFILFDCKILDFKQYLNVNQCHYILLQCQFFILGSCILMVGWLHSTGVTAPPCGQKL